MELQHASVGHTLLLGVLIIIGLGLNVFVLAPLPNFLRAKIDTGDQASVSDIDAQPAGSNVTTILYWTARFGNVVPPLTGVEHRTCQDSGGASLECAFTSDKQQLDQAHVVVFHASHLQLAEMPAARSFTSQLWAYWSSESPVNDNRWCEQHQCDQVSLDPQRLALFDLRMGYQLWSDVLDAYIFPWLKTYTDQPMSPSWQERRNAVVRIASNCNSTNKREKYIAEFMKYYPVHSYGHCLRTMPDDVSDEELVPLMSQYKFAFAWENSNCADYVTEKLEHAFWSGGLPIVDGPDDYSLFVPNNHSVIHVSDFAGPKALADYLRLLETDQALYESYFTYKPPTSHYDPTFLPVPESADLSPDIRCKLCRTVARLRKESQLGGDPRAGRKKVVQPDETCTQGRWDREYYDDGTMSSAPP